MDLFEYSKTKKDIFYRIDKIIKEISQKNTHEKIEIINIIRKKIHDISPFKSEPIDCVLWVNSDSVKANDYNPNSVAPPEMELLRHSINHDGYTQPVVTWKKEDHNEVVDGFHRTRVCKEFEDVNKRVMGYLPIVCIKEECYDRNDRIASTIRHNRARGKHNVDSMSDIVIELKRRNWSPARIGKELGMDQDEVLRLCQISGLSEMFNNEDFSSSWDIDILSEDDLDIIFNEELIEPDKEIKETRILHTYDKWECYKNGFYSNTPPVNFSEEDCEKIYAEFLSNIELFEAILDKVINEWKYSCEHYLTNDSMNRIAWLGQAALCYHHKIPSKYRSGYSLLSKEQQLLADKSALKYLNIWLLKNGFEEVSEEIIINKPKADIY